MSATTSPPLYQPLDTSRRQIRLMMVTSGPHDEEIRCSIHTFDLDTMPRYIALSYVWGEDQGLRTIFVNSYEYQIRPGLFEFLQLFKTWDDCRPIWIDQICINQNNVEEKNHQVGIMEHIYRGAQETFCWLGQDPSLGLALSAARKLVLASIDEGEDWNLEGFLSNPEIVAFTTLAYLPYWKRLWIIQELHLSSAATLVHGSHLLPYRELLGSCVNETRQLWSRAIRVWPARESMMVTILKFSYGGIVDKAGEFQDFGSTAGTSICLDPRDKIYGLQSLLPATMRVEVDYQKPVAILYREAVKTWYRALRPQIHDGVFSDGCRGFARGMGISSEEFINIFSEDAARACGENDPWLVWITHYLEYMHNFPFQIKCN